MSRRPIRVVIVEDQDLVRSGLSALAEHDGDIAVVGLADNGASGLEQVRRHRPDLVLMDVRMPVLDGITATRRVVADPDLDGVRVLILTTFDEDETVFDAIRAGACGYLLKDISPEELRRSIRLVAEGDSLLSPAVTGRVMAGLAAAPRPDPSLVEGLSEREREVLAAIGQGYTNDEIAHALVISPATARTYVSRLLTKLHARDRVALVIHAYRAGLVTSD